MIDAVLVKKANRMMTVASLLEDGIELGFADGARGSFPTPIFLRSESVRPCPRWSCPTRTRWF